MSSGTYVKVGSVWKAVTALWKNIGGTWHNVPAAFTNVGGVWKQVFFGALSATVSDPNPTGAGNPGGVGTTDVTTCTPIGGVAPYTHNWNYVSGDTGISRVYGVATAGQAFKRNIPVGGGVVSWFATWQDTVTDSASNVFSVQVNIEIDANI